MATSITNTSVTTDNLTTDGLTVDTDTIHVDSTNNRVGINTTNGPEALNISGNGNLRFQTTNTVRIEYLNTTGAYALGTTGGAAIGFNSPSTGNDEIFFETHNGGVSHAERMRINKDGYVTTPNQPMVRMSLGSHFGRNNVHPSAPGGQITGFTVHENIGNHWNNSNSEFTCPVTGVYCVAIFYIKFPVSGAAHVDLHKNNSHLTGIRWRGHEGGTSYHQVGGTVFVSCAANDVLNWKYFGAPGIHDGNGQWGIRLVG